MKIMVVDDSHTLRNIQKNVLSKLGHTDVLEAGDGIEALQILETENPELLLVDWNMPNMDGLTLVRRIRETDNETRIVMCTTEAQKKRVSEAVKAGVNNFVVKPFNAESLDRTIDETMSQSACGAAGV